MGILKTITSKIKHSELYNEACKLGYDKTVWTPKYVKFIDVAVKFDITKDMIVPVGETTLPTDLILDPDKPRKMKEKWKVKPNWYIILRRDPHWSCGHKRIMTDDCCPVCLYFFNTKVQK